MSLHHHKYEAVENVTRHELPREFVSWSFFKIRARNLRPNAGKLQTRNFRSVISSLDVRFKIWGLKLSILSSVRFSLCVHARINVMACLVDADWWGIWFQGVCAQKKKTHHTTSSFEHLQGPRKIFEKFIIFSKILLFFSPSLFGAKLFRVYSAKTESIRQDPSLFGCKTSLFGKNRVHSVAE